ncbi:hypothetical protein PTH_2341 [Pelotomaculum thermopropionicum SI]|uniref:Uncharacterized protein n=1 Tax=Pelotomaculum thermopropionicum (strain DSM 13744 / JCM 10971 / SI) TaxID=370438 RepID=A5CZR6_PELTS|nr:hypothetical protein PTH_2341 [Pelotomaculum thermopropionicum SI]
MRITFEETKTSRRYIIFEGGNATGQIFAGSSFIFGSAHLIRPPVFLLFLLIF